MRPAAGPCSTRGVSEREEFLDWVDTELRDAEVAAHNGDLAPRRALWSQQEPVTVFGAWKSAVGRADVEELFTRLEGAFSHCASYETELVAAEALGDLAYVVGYEHTSATVEGEPRTYTLRVTHICRREDGEWKVVHRHAEVPPDAE